MRPSRILVAAVMFLVGLIWVGQGTGTPMEVEVPLPWNGTAYWRLRVSP